MWTYKIKKTEDEYIVMFLFNGLERKEARYFTNDPDDARQTGNLECIRLNDGVTKNLDKRSRRHLDMQTYNIISSNANGTHGDVAFVIDKEGNILEDYFVYADDNKKIVSFNTRSYIEIHGELHDTIDILDIGFTWSDGIEVSSTYRSEV